MKWLSLPLAWGDPRDRSTYKVIVTNEDLISFWERVEWHSGNLAEDLVLFYVSDI